MPSIRKRPRRAGGHVWQVRWKVAGVAQSASFDRLRDAKVFAAERDREAAKGGRRLDARGGAAPLVAVWDAWAQRKSAEVRAKTWRHYEDAWRLRIEPVLGVREVRSITENDVAAVMAQLTVGPWAVRETFLVLRSVLGVAVERGLIVENPAAMMRIPSGPRQNHHRYLTAVEVRQLADACARDGDVVVILAYTGIRWGELAGLRVADVDLPRRRLYVRRTVTDVSGQLVEGPPKTAAGRRTVPLAKVAAKALGVRVKGRGGGEFAVPAPRGGPMSAPNWRRRAKWADAIEMAGISPSPTLHDLRHTYASLARAAGADLTLVSKTMGHSSVAVTGDVYADLFDDELDGVAVALDMLDETERVRNEDRRGPDVAQEPFDVPLPGMDGSSKMQVKR